MLDERWIRSLHVEAMRRADLHVERDPHVLGVDLADPRLAASTHAAIVRAEGG